MGAFSAIASWSILRHRESNTIKLPIDVVGLALLVIGVGSLQFMLDNGNDKDWFNSPVILAAAVTPFVAVAFFIPWELTDKHPVVDLHLFAKRNFRVGTCTLAMAFFAFSGVNIIFPLWLQTTVGYTATWAGLAVAPVGLLGLVIAPIVGRNMMRLNLRLAASFAFCVFGFSVFWTATLNESASYLSICDAAIPARLGHGIFLPAIESNPDVRHCFERAGLRFRSQQLHAYHVRQLFDRRHGMDMESAQRLPSRGADRTHQQFFAFVDFSTKLSLARIISAAWAPRNS